MSSIKKNFLYNVAYQILLIILPLITAPYISRVLGATGVGIQSYTYSVAYYFTLVGMLGMSNLGNRSIAEKCNDRNKRSEIFSNLYTLQIISYSIVILVYLIFIQYTDSQYKVMYKMQFIYLLAGAIDISWFYFGMEKFKITVMRNVIIKVLTVILIFIFVKHRTDLWKYALIMSLSMLSSQIYLWCYLGKYISFKHISYTEIKSYVKPLLILFIPIIAYSVYKVMDKIMLGNMSTMEQVGYYENAVKIVNIPMGIIAAFGTVMLPRMSNIVTTTSREIVIKYIEISIKFVTVIAVGICFGLIGISDNLAPTYFGREYISCGPIISMLSVTCVFVAWASVIRTQYLIPQKVDTIYLISTSVGAILNLLINLVMIPKFAAQGAAIGTIIAEISVVIVQVIALRNDIKIYKYIYSTLGYIFIGCIMAFMVHQLGNNLGRGWEVLIKQILLGVCIYSSLIYIYMKIRGDQLLDIITNKARVTNKPESCSK